MISLPAVWLPAVRLPAVLSLEPLFPAALPPAVLLLECLSQGVQPESRRQWAAPLRSAALRRVRSLPAALCPARERPPAPAPHWLLPQ